MANGTLTLNIDRGEFIARLIRAKMPKAQAQAFTDGLERDVEISPGDLVTGGVLDTKLADLKKDMIILFQRGQTATIIAVVGLNFAGVGLLLAFFR